MAKTTKVAQRRWMKGVNASAQAFAQPAGSFPRGSNLVFTRRGALITVDGSLILSALGGMTPLPFNPYASEQWRELFYYNPSTFLRTGYYGLYTAPGTQLANTGTVTLAAVTSTHGLTGTFFVQVRAVDGIGGESLQTSEPSITLSSQGLQISWPAVTRAYGYNIYIGNSSGGEVLWLPPGSSPNAAGVSVVAQGSGTQTVTVDSTWISNPNQQPSSSNTSSGTDFTAVPLGGWSAANLLTAFPASVGVVLTQSPSVIFNSGGGAPVTTTTELRPTSSVQGGPLGGTPNDFQNQQLAFDNNFATASIANVPPGGNNGAQRTWTGFPAAPAGVTALTLNVSSSYALASPNNQNEFLLLYSLNAGATYQQMSLQRANYAQSTASVTLPVAQDLTQIRVTAYVFSIPTTATASVFEIWVAATTTLTPGTPPPGSLQTSGGSTANGGLTGVLGPLPEIVQFTDKMILALGNGFPPYQSDGLAADTIPLGNTFQASYASRTPSTPQNVGDQIAATIGTTAYIFTVVQAGTTSSSGSVGGGPPGATATLGSIVADGTVYWKNSGAVATSTPPRGAAHEIVYAGSLWVFNTFPATTSDNFDGPSCLKMSDLNNPNSWNPLNVAFLDRDDGSEGMGLATFTIAESGIPPVGSLVAFKNFSTFQINGVFGASNFSIQRAQTDMGCSAPRTIQFVPGFGIVRLAHLGFAMFDGVRDRLLSEEIRPYLFGDLTQPDIIAVDWGVAYFSKGAQAASPPMYVCACPLLNDGASLLEVWPGVSVSVVANSSSTLPTGNYFVQVGVRSPNGVSALSPVFGPFAITAGVNMLQVLTGGGKNFRVFFGTNSSLLNQYVDGNAATIDIAAPGLPGTPPLGIPGAMTRIFAYDLVLRAWAIVDLPFNISVLHQTRIAGQQPQTISGGFYDTTLRRLFFGDPTFDGVQIAWSVRTPEVFGRNASDRTYFRELGIRGEGNPFGVAARVVVSGSGGQTLATRNSTVAPMGGGEFAAYFDIGVTGVDAHATISGSGPIEIQSVDWFAVAKSGRGRVVAG